MALIIGRVGLLSFHQLTVAACWCGRCTSFFRILLAEVTAPTPQTMGRLLAVCPNVAKFLAITALHKTILGFIGIYPDCDVAKAWQSENFF
jgi:hypothetical protein